MNDRHSGTTALWIGARATALALGIAAAVWACGPGNEPTGDPKTPPNTPLPSIDKKDPDKGSSPVGDAG